tara:strand:- start:584 stop:1396 length:813 start_codon:yes stop_codon:yes gene_type:complete
MEKSNIGKDNKSLKEIFNQIEISIHKWENYFKIYEHYLEKYRGKNPRLLEIGVQYGGSLKMWEKYFINGEINGIDINPDCKKLEDNNIKIYIGSQNDKKFLKEFADSVEDLDIIIDDGGHTMEQQLNSFKILFPKVKDGGVYIVEDIESSYQNMYGGGPKRRGTFIEFSKNIVDYMNANHSDFNTLNVNWYSKNIEYVHFYNNVVVFKKQNIQNFPISYRNNSNKTIDNDKRARVSKFKLFISLVISTINKVLGYLRIKPLYIGSTSQRF